MPFEDLVGVEDLWPVMYDRIISPSTFYLLHSTNK